MAVSSGVSTAGRPRRGWWLLQRYGYLLAVIPMIQAVGGFLLGGWRAWHVLVTAFVLVPVLDAVLGEDPSPPPAGDLAPPSLWHDGMLYGFVVGYWLVLVVGLLHVGEWSGVERLGNSLSMGVIGGVGIVVAHELGHRQTRLGRLLAACVLQPVCYGHFTLEHNRGHHAWVATPADPATARYGESFYRFYRRCVPGTWRAGWRLEAARLARCGLPAWHWRNAMWRHCAVPLLIGVVVAGVFGPLGLLFWLMQAVVAFTLLELVNYLEHYGLTRRQVGIGADGEPRYEAVAPHHSWNANHVLSNLFIYQLQRHSDHHAWPARPYHALRPCPQAPQLPSGYTTMIPLALVPPLWFHVMNPRVEAWRARHPL